MSEANLAIVRQMYDAFAKRDIDTIVDLVDPDIELHQTDLLPWGGDYHGHEGLMTFFGKLVEHIDSQVTHEKLISAGDHVVQVGRTSGTVNATGRTFSIDEVHVWKLRDGKAVHFESYVDTPAMLEALRS
jgi:ketosteroid isomerase-like protein